jgi:hypothetical protein
MRNAFRMLFGRAAAEYRRDQEGTGSEDAQTARPT